MVVISVALSVSIRVDSEHNLQAKYSFGFLPISSSNLAPGASGVPRPDWTKSPLRCAASHAQSFLCSMIASLLPIRNDYQSLLFLF